MNSAIYWGSFDPLTVAHQAIIEKVLALRSIRKLIIVINNDARKSYLAEINHRINMLRLALPIVDKVIEIKQQDLEHQHTYKVIKENIGMKLFVVAGMDSLINWQGSLTDKYDGIYLIPRMGYEKKKLAENVYLLSIKDSYKNVSSKKSRVRFAKELAENSSIKYNSDLGVSKPVLSYINRNRLYR